MMLEDLFALLEIPEEVRREVKAAEASLDLAQVAGMIRGLTDRDGWQEAHAALKQYLGADEKGFQMFACMLQAMKITYENYLDRGIGEEIFTATMKCFPRFIKEHRESFGCYGFDRDWWVGRQLSMQLFRIGELEYEFVREEDRPEVSLHIPSDAVLTQEKCRESYALAKAFIAQFFPEFAKAGITCCSWLLSPALEELLPADSHINRFRQAFAVTEWDRESLEFLQWVYRQSDVPIALLSENTTLQRRMKAYLLQGGKVGEAKGRFTWE